MATIVKVTKGTSDGARKLAQTITSLRSGFGDLAEMNGVRAQAIAESQDKMASMFGVDGPTNAQVMSDRWAYLFAAMNDATHEAYAGLQCLRDFIDAVDIV